MNFKKKLSRLLLITAFVGLFISFGNVSFATPIQLSDEQATIIKNNLVDKYVIGIASNKALSQSHIETSVSAVENLNTTTLKEQINGCLNHIQTTSGDLNWRRYNTNFIFVKRIRTN